MDQERYELVDVIGSGGMATVWRARDTSLGRVVAVKRPHPAPEDSTVLQRFTREARAAATITHPNLVSVFDVGEDDAGPYLVMEYVDGPSLATATVPPDEAARSGAQVASALAALHAAGVIHGDVKPGNILVAGGDVKLTDFGIARTGDDTALTRDGLVYATPEYAAPETLAGEERSAAADVYALGAVLHELVTGSRWSPSAASTQAMPPAPWASVLAPALSRDPAARPTAAVFGAQLAGLDHAAPQRAASPTAVQAPLLSPMRTDTRDSRKTIAILAGSIMALAVVAGVVALADDDDGIDTMTPAAATSTPAAGDVVATAPLPAPIEPTAPSIMTPPITTPPITAQSPAAEPVTPATAIADELVALLAQEVSQGMKSDDAARIVEHLDEAMRAAGSGDTKQAEGSLRDALRDIERRVSDDTRDQAVDRLLALAVELGVDPDRVVDSGGKGNDDDD